jgi:hypothetical protein
VVGRASGAWSLSRKASGRRVRAKTIVAIAGDRWFESSSLQRRVSKLSVPVYNGLKGLPGDDVTPDRFVTFWCDGSRGLYIHPNIGTSARPRDSGHSASTPRTVQIAPKLTSPPGAGSKSVIAEHEQNDFVYDPNLLRTERCTGLFGRARAAA